MSGRVALSEEASAPRVLVLDDEEPIRTLSRQLLRLLGYDAETVSTGETIGWP